MLWFKNKSELKECVEKFNLERVEIDGRKIVLLFGNNYHVFSGVIGFNEIEVFLNREFTKFMSRAENLVYLDFSYANTGIHQIAKV